MFGAKEIRFFSVVLFGLQIQDYYFFKLILRLNANSDWHETFRRPPQHQNTPSVIQVLRNYVLTKRYSSKPLKTAVFSCFSTFDRLLRLNDNLDEVETFRECWKYKNLLSKIRVFYKHFLTKSYSLKPLKIAVFWVFYCLVCKIHASYYDVKLCLTT